MTNLSDASLHDLKTMLDLLESMRGTMDTGQLDDWTTMVRSEVRRRFASLAEGAAILEAARAARAAGSSGA